VLYKRWANVKNGCASVALRYESLTLTIKSGRNLNPNSNPYPNLAMSDFYIQALWAHGINSQCVD